MSSLGPIIRVQATSSRYPCPDGTSLGVGQWNGTLFLICDSAFNKGAEGNLDLALGIGLGLGLPLLISVICLFYCCKDYYKCKITDRTTHTQQRPQIKNTIFVASSSQSVSLELTEQSYANFCFDILSDELKKELMILRLQKGRNLTEYVQVAQQKNASTVATWIDHMNPGEFPVEIRHAAAKSIPKPNLTAAQEQEKV